MTDSLFQGEVKPILNKTSSVQEIVVEQVSDAEVSLSVATQLESNGVEKAAFEAMQLTQMISSEKIGEPEKRRRRKLQLQERQQTVEIKQSEQEPQECLKAEDDFVDCFVCPKLIECLHRRV